MKNILAVLIPASPNVSRTEIEILSVGRRVADELGGTLGVVTLGATTESWN